MQFTLSLVDVGFYAVEPLLKSSHRYGKLVRAGGAWTRGMVTSVGHVRGARNGRMLVTTLFCTACLNSHAFCGFGPPSQPPQGDKAGFLPGGPGGIYIPLCMYRCNAAYGRPTKSEQPTYVLALSHSLGRQSYGSAIGTAVSRWGGNSDPRKLEAVSRRPS